MYKIKHEEYDSNTLKNDIALFKMDSPVNTDIYLPVCMPPHGAHYENKKGCYYYHCLFVVVYCCLAWVTGWGTTSENGDQATVLQELELAIVSDSACYSAMTGALGTYWGLVRGGTLGSEVRL